MANYAETMLEMSLLSQQRAAGLHGKAGVNDSTTNAMVDPARRCRTNGSVLLRTSSHLITKSP